MTAQMSRRDAVVVNALHIAERGVALMNRRVGSFLDRVQLHLRAYALARDPETEEWVASVKAKLASGELDKQLAAQPKDPQVLLDRRRTTHGP